MDTWICGCPQITTGSPNSRHDFCENYKGLYGNCKMSKKLRFKCLEARASLFLKKMYHKNESFSYVMWQRNGNRRFARFVRFAGWWIKVVGSDPNEDMVRHKIISFTLNGEFFIQRYPAFFVQHFVPILPSALDPLLSLVFLHQSACKQAASTGISMLYAFPTRVALLKKCVQTKNANLLACT